MNKISSVNSRTCPRDGFPELTPRNRRQKACFKVESLFENQTL